MNRSIASLLEKATPTELALLVHMLLEPHMSPVFGAAKIVDHEVAAFEALRKLGFVSPRPDEYELVLKLRITKAKARNLIYQAELRGIKDVSDIDDRLRELISNPLFDPGTTSDSHWILEVPNPLLMDALRSRIRKLRFISDGSFSPTLARIHKRVFPALIEDLIPPDRRAEVFQAIRTRVLTDRATSTSDLLTGMLVQLGNRAAGEAGAVFGREAAEALCDLMKVGSAKVVQLLTTNDIGKN